MGKYVPKCSQLTECRYIIQEVPAKGGPNKAAGALQNWKTPIAEVNLSKPKYSTKTSTCRAGIKPTRQKIKESTSFKWKS